MYKHHEDPTGPLAGESAYGFPLGEPEEGQPKPLPQRIAGATFGAEGIAASADRGERRIDGEAL